MRLETAPTVLGTAKLTLMVRLGNRTYRPGNRTNPVNLVLYVKLCVLLQYFPKMKINLKMATNCGTIQNQQEGKYENRYKRRDVTRSV